MDRVRSLGTNDATLIGETARHLAVWMSYEDIIRVADLKTRASRFERVRKEAGAKAGEPVVVIDYLKPGVEEVASLLPPALGRSLVAWAEKNGKLDAYNVGMHVKTSGMFGFLMTRSLAWLKPWRPHSYRYAEEQQLIERWLGHVRDAAEEGACRSRSKSPNARASSRATATRTGAARRASSPSWTRWWRTRPPPTPTNRRSRSGKPATPRSPILKAKRSAARSAGR